ncbi:MAG: HEAT repeat domain-containing protein [Polyangiaceae bacterium]
MPTLSSLLVHRSVASMQAVEDAIARQVVYGDDLATNVLEVGAAREDDVTRLAAESLGMFALPPGKIVLLDPGVLRLIPGDVAQRYGIFPIEKRGQDLVVATSEPLSQNIEDDLGFLLNLNLRPVYALHVRIVQALADHYGQTMERRYKRLLAKLEGRKAHETEPPPAGAAQIAALPKTAAAPVKTPVLPTRLLEPPPRPLPGEGAAAQGAEPAIMPDRPTLRGLQVPVAVAEDDSWGPAPENAAAGLPATIELSPLPPLAAEPIVAPVIAPADARITVPAEPTLRDVQATISKSPSSLPVTVRAPSTQGVPPEALSAPPLPKIEGVPQALAAFARPFANEADARTAPAPPKGPRARRKGPFPADIAEDEMASAATTDGVLEVFFDFAQQYFEYAALFVVHGDIAEGRDASGRGSDRARVTAVGLPLDLPSALASARERRAPVLADFTADGLDAELAVDLGRAPASAGGAPSPTAPSKRADAVVIPIVVRGRAVALLFGDDAPAPVELVSIGEVIAFAGLAGAAIERLILRKKMGQSATARLTPAAIGAVAPRAEGPAAIAGAAPEAAKPAATKPPVAAPTKATTSPVPQRAVARAGLAALARMFAPPAPKPAAEKDGAAARTKSEAPPPPAKEAAPKPTSEPPRAPEQDIESPRAPEQDVEPPRAPEQDVEPPHAPEPAAAAPLEESPPVGIAASRSEEPFLLTPSAQGRGADESFALAARTPPPDVIVGETPAPLVEDAASEEPAPLAPEQTSDSGSDALTVALTLSAESPAPRRTDAIEPANAPENETHVVPDEALETVEPAPAEPSVPIELSGSEPADVDSNAETAVPPIALRPDIDGSATHTEDHAAAADDSAAAEPLRAAADRPRTMADRVGTIEDRPSTTGDRLSTMGDRPSTMGDRPSSTDGRPSAPIVVDVFADSTEGITSALARAAEEVSVRRERRQSADDAKAARKVARDREAPPEETLTEGFPAAGAEASHLTAETPDPTPFLDADSESAQVDASDAPSISESAASPPVNESAASPWTGVTLEALLLRAARGADQADARVELARRAERNLAPLIALFPGPLDQDRHRSADRLPAASQCGPLLEALARAGARGAATVAVLARHDNVDVRFWAAHLLGEIASPEAADGLLPFLVDPDPAVRRVALRSAASVLGASLPGRPLEAALGYVARDAQTPMRERIAAIDAMGQLRASFFVPVLIGLLGAVPDEVAETARRSLLVLTRQDFARDAARWNEWWSRNDARHRIEWLIDALMHDTQSIRRAAGDELKNLTKEYFGYYDDLPRRERERAQERYREWWEREGRARFK